MKGSLTFMVNSRFLLFTNLIITQHLYKYPHKIVAFTEYHFNMTHHNAHTSMKKFQNQTKKQPLRFRIDRK